MKIKTILWPRSKLGNILWLTFLALMGIYYASRSRLTPNGLIEFAIGYASFLVPTMVYLWIGRAVLVFTKVIKTDPHPTKGEVSEDQKYSNPVA